MKNTKIQLLTPLRFCPRWCELVARTFSYDLNDNLTKDKNKQITNITYNRMNLPISTNFYSDEEETKNISYPYTVNGEKLRVQTSTNGGKKLCWRNWRN